MPKSHAERASRAQLSPEQTGPAEPSRYAGEIKKKATELLGVALLMGALFIAALLVKEVIPWLMQWMHPDVSIVDPRLDGVWRNAKDNQGKFVLSDVLSIDARNSKGHYYCKDEAFEITFNSRLDANRWSVEVICYRTGATVSEEGSTIERTARNQLHLMAKRRQGDAFDVLFETPER